MSKDRKEFFIPLVVAAAVVPPANVMQEPMNHIGVSVDYWKDARKRGIYATATPVHRRADNTDIWEVTAGKSVLVFELARASAKKIDEGVAAVEAQLKAKSGPVWDNVLAVVEKEGLTLA